MANRKFLVWCDTPGMRAEDGYKPRDIISGNCRSAATTYLGMREFEEGLDEVGDISMRVLCFDTQDEHLVTIKAEKTYLFAVKRAERLNW